jgi:hypothetical protein
MTLPETIPVRFTEEEAEYLSVRPVRRQVFRIEQLVDMILCVTGKDQARIEQILRAGSVVFHFYRYWWQGFEADSVELSRLLSKFPGDNPSRKFRPEECSAVLIEAAGRLGRDPIELPRALAARRKLFRRRSFWDALLSVAERKPPAYQHYSYTHRADIFALPVDAAEKTILAAEAKRLARRELRAQLSTLTACQRVLFVCPREKQRSW